MKRCAKCNTQQETLPEDGVCPACRVRGVVHGDTEAYWCFGGHRAQFDAMKKMGGAWWCVEHFPGAVS